jgi:hypothetical protein
MTAVPTQASASPVIGFRTLAREIGGRGVTGSWNVATLAVGITAGNGPAQFEVGECLREALSRLG